MLYSLQVQTNDNVEERNRDRD